MPKSFRINPLTGDFVRDERGGWVLTDTAETAVQLQLVHHYRAWWGAPERGSRLQDPRSFTGANKVQAVKTEAERAMRVLEQAGRIANVEVVAEQTQPGRIAVEINARDTATGKAIAVKHRT
jgi:phage gp46-like protein